MKLFILFLLITSSCWWCPREAEAQLQGRLTSMTPLDEKSELAASLKKFKPTEFLASDLKRQGRRLAFDLATVLTFGEVPGQSVIVPIVDEKTGKLVGAYYLYGKDRDREWAATMENADKERSVLLGTPGKPKSLRVEFDAQGKFSKAEVIGPEGPERKIWGCVVDRVQKVPGFVNVFTGAICVNCLIAAVTMLPCTACAVSLSGLFSYGLYACAF